MKEENLPVYMETVRSLQKEYQEKMQIYLGIELDADTQMDLSPFDYVIGSLHTLRKDGVDFPVDADRVLLRNCCDSLFDGDFCALMRHYYDSLYQFVQKQPFTVLGHFDLPLKYNKDGTFMDESDKAYQKNALEALDGVMDTVQEGKQ